MIPFIIYQTWHTKKLPAEMRESVNQIKKAAPEFTYMLFDDTDCLEFIQEYFPSNVVDAYNRLIPGAYKADLWRYCVLYVTGGIYIDIKYRPVPMFKMINLTKSEHFVNDLQDGYTKVDGVYNGVMVCKPQNTALLKCIHEIVHNVNVSYFGRSPLEPTGPILLRKHNKFTDMQLRLNAHEQLQIIYNKSVIMYSYLNYRKEQRTFEIYPHYSRLWLARSIYRRVIPQEMVRGSVDDKKSNKVSPMTNEPVLDGEPAVSDEPVSEEPVSEEPVADEPLSEEPLSDEPVADEPVADEPVADEPVADEPVAEEPVADEPVSDEPMSDEPVSEEPVSDEPVSDEPVSDEPVSDEPVFDEPVSDEPVFDEPEQIKRDPLFKKRERLIKKYMKKQRPLVVYRPNLNNIIFNSH